MIGRKVVVDDGADILDMDASCHNIGSDQRLHPSGSEILQRPGALVLVPPTVDRRGQDACSIELTGYPIRATAGTAEDDRGPRGIDRAGTDLDTVRPGHVPEHMVRIDDVGSPLSYSCRTGRCW